MKFGICLLSVIPVRKESSDASEMITQILFGELFAITEVKESWVKIRIVYDNYEGWVDKKQITVIGETEFNRLNKLSQSYSLDLIEIVHHKEMDTIIPIMLGSTLRLDEINQFKVGDNTFTFDGDNSVPESSPSVSNIIENAMIYINSPYLWGGRSPFGIDCSGFTQIVFKISGVKLYRDSYQQATQGETISFINDAEPADLLFFDNEEGSITHVGMYIGDQQLIHASGKVRIDPVDHNGIYNKELNKYTHKLRLIKRIL